MFEPYPWIKRWACSRSWAVAPVLQYFRALRGELSPPLIKFIQPASFLAQFAQVFITLRIPYLDFEKNHGTVNALTESCTSSTSARHLKALSTSFEKTCMRQIHCPDRLIAMVNKGPYHAQGLFKLKRTQSRTRASLWFCCVRICSCWKLRRHKVCANCQNMVWICPFLAK